MQQVAVMQVQFRYLLKVSNKRTLSETTLWTNPSPTSNFAAQNVTLTQSVTASKFDLLEIEWVNKNTNVAFTGKTCIDVATYLNTSSAANAPKYAFGSYKFSSYDYVREAYYVSSTSMGIAGAYPINANRTADNSTIVPTKITGIKFPS